MPTKSNPVGDLIRKVQTKLEQRVSVVSHDEVVLKQSNVWVRAVTWSLIGTTVFAIGWLAIARTEEIVVAQGKLEPKGDVKEVQIPVGGVAREILVKGGDRVKKDQILIQLDTETSKQQVESLEETEIEKKKQLVKKQEQLKLKLKEKQRIKELTQEQLSTTKTNLALNEEILGRYKVLVEQGASAELQYLTQRNQVHELIGEVAKLKVDGQRQLAVVDQQIEQLNSELAGLRSELAQLKAQLTEARVTLKYKSLRSPVDGVVFDLKPTTTGFVAQSSEPVLKIVPFNELEADVEIPSNKIGFVRVGMHSDISIDSFPATDFGVLEGKVSSIGSDALPPDQQKQRPEYRYPAVIKLDSQQLKLKNGTSLPLQVGMSLTANIKLRSVSYLQLLLGEFQNKTDSLRKI
ncbi:MAG: HlyD family secretion protein [Prochlorococcus sp.]|nr:HlyD family efflux transporter periplasmic adaptor subunit [Prochlorococcaceae cyanobacterium Fu_MAG_50]